MNNNIPEDEDNNDDHGQGHGSRENNDDDTDLPAPDDNPKQVTMVPFNAEKYVGGHTNGERARRASEALDYYKDCLLQEGGTADDDEVVDLFTDLLHYCDREGYEAATLLLIAEKNHKAER